MVLFLRWQDVRCSHLQVPSELTPSQTDLAFLLSPFRFFLRENDSERGEKKSNPTPSIFFASWALWGKSGKGKCGKARPAVAKAEH